MDKLDALSAFAALSQETRLDVLRLLIEAGPQGLAAGDIGTRLGVRQNTMSTNLAVLAHAGLLIGRREGRHIRYVADFDRVRGLIDFLMRDCCGGKPELCTPLPQIACAC